jgi:excisionase family DNA binding protein
MIATTEIRTAPTHDLLTLEEAASILRCSKAHLSNVLNGKVSSLPPLPHVSLGRRKLIRKAALEQWLKRLEESGDPEVMS